MKYLPIKPAKAPAVPVLPRPVDLARVADQKYVERYAI